MTDTPTGRRHFFDHVPYHFPTRSLCVDAQRYGRGLRPGLAIMDEFPWPSPGIPDLAALEARVLGWSTPTIPPMLRAVEPAEPAESASVVMLRTLLAARRETKRQAESSNKSRIRQAEDAERRAADLRERAKADTETAEQADAEIAAVLADIEKLGGRPETEKEA